MAENDEKKKDLILDSIEIIKGGGFRPGAEDFMVLRMFDETYVVITPEKIIENIKSIEKARDIYMQEKIFQGGSK